MDAQGKAYKNWSVRDAFRAIHSGQIEDTSPVIWCWQSQKVLDLVRASEGGISRLPIIHEAKLLEQCGDFTFAVELIEEFLTDQAGQATEAIIKSIRENDHKAFTHESHSVKGVAKNLYLTAIGTIATEMDAIGKILLAHKSGGGCKCGACENGFKISDLLRDREPLLKELLMEIDRLNKHMAVLEQKAAAEEEDEEFGDDEEFQD
eukprot:g68841.t1